MPMLRYAGLAGLILAGLALAAAEASGQAAGLTNQDVVKMVRADLSPQIIRTTIESAAVISFDMSPDGLVALKAAGVSDDIIGAMQARLAVVKGPSSLGAPEKSAPLETARAPADILRTFKTMAVDAKNASFFGAAQVVAELRKQKDFDALGITIVDDVSLADVLLEVSYTFPWDYPYRLLHQNSSVVLLSGKGSGAFSGPEGARSVAGKVVKQLKASRSPSSRPQGETAAARPPVR